MIQAGILGATGYAGQQLIWFLLRHPSIRLNFLSSHNHTDISFHHIYQQYAGFIQNVCIDMHAAEEKLSDIDVLFIALPHGKAFDITKKALDLGVKVIDLGADFRLKSADAYKAWYGLEHEAEHLLSTAVYGLPEIYRDQIPTASLVANPGCYPTASILALAPLLKNHLIDPASIIIDAKSGVSGAGRAANIATLFTECNESIKAYGVASHRHTPEIEEILATLYGKELVISFTPHLVPMNRGILATCYGNLLEKQSQSQLYEIYNAYYQDEYFVRIVETLPETRWVKGSNLCDIGVKVDERTGRVIVVSAIDNLIKGAAGQAVQNMNLMFGFKEQESLDVLSMTP
ncbi:N-acetyl-gamma-glutamyl-phosphate reductase [Anaerosolibacter carboniphilus]|uniref:N-acetyl-gamma-glutamyl-phosphate reductase n=1 Tax=Anaerosolibacter carboniphilus TaxID=1417629 RepID=A0A841L1B4_9FIRM|nr:N-acetyl-gamma-glutamyl-phosphate reductase [Anaerosolibacter carboniphilus]MBB6218398.1 N-acetyl-gamma-glutamyl-phosphate reductase [Anaerosolibacter carboniphilus]